MDGRLEDGAIVVGGDARQRFYDARGYGRPRTGNEIELAPVEAAHLLFREDLDRIDGMDFREFFARYRGDGLAATFLVYADLRGRGFYLSPDREGWVPEPDPDSDLVVYPRGKGPADGVVRYRLRVVGEREPIPATELGDLVLAVVDEESEITYFETDRPDLAGSTTYEPAEPVQGDLLADRVVVWEPPVDLHERGFYGQPLSGRGGERAGQPLQLSLVEAASLARDGTLVVEGGPGAIVERGRTVEGERFDRRLATYAALRRKRVVPKTGFKFGADFRTYADVTSVDDLGHSEFLVRVLPTDHAFAPRDLALDVRLAHGVRKRMAFALVDDARALDDDGIDWVSVGRLTP